MGCMCVLVAVSAQSLPSAWHLRAPDGSSLSAHVMLISKTLALSDGSIAQEQLALGVRCMSNLLLSTARRLVEVRAPQLGASPLPLSLPACRGAVLGLWKACIAAQAVLLRTLETSRLHVYSGLWQLPAHSVPWSRVLGPWVWHFTPSC